MAVTNKYTDLDFKMRMLTSGDISKKSDVNAINQSLKSLFNTIRGERFFNLDYGSSLPFLLFEPFDTLTANSIGSELRDIIKIWEDDRIEVTDIEVKMDYDIETYIVSMEYQIKSTTETGNFELILQKK